MESIVPESRSHDDPDQIRHRTRSGVGARKAGTGGEKTLRRKFDRRRTYWSSCFLAPALLIIFTCVIFPGVLAFALSWTRATRFGTIHWAGYYNYRKLIEDPVARQSFFNTLLYVAFFVPLNIVLALAVALLLKPNFRGMKLIRTVYFVPAVLSSMVTVSIFRFLYDARHGPIGAFLETLGYAPIAWLAQTGYAMAAIIGLTLWNSIPFNAIIFLAALQSVPTELHEAARMDGAGALRRLFNVTVPSLRPMIGALTVLSTIGAFRVFDPMYVLTQGGPANSTRSIALHAYLAGFRDGELGYSSAVSFVLLAIILLATLLMNRIGRDQQ